MSGKPRQFALYVKLLLVRSSALHSAFSLRVKAPRSESTEMLVRVPGDAVAFCLELS